MILSTTWDSPGIVKCFKSFLIPSSIIKLLKLINLMNSSLIFIYISSYPPIRTPIFEKLSLLMFSCKNYAIDKGFFSSIFSFINALITLNGFYVLLKRYIAYFNWFFFDFLKKCWLSSSIAITLWDFLNC